MRVTKLYICGVLTLMATIGYGTFDGWFASSIIIPNPKRIDPTKEIQILGAIQEINRDFSERKWNSFQLDVTDDFSKIIKDTSFSDLLKYFADFNGREPVKFDPDKFEDGKIYYLGIIQSSLFRLPIKNRKLCRSCDLIISVKYIEYDKYEFQDAAIVMRQAWP